MFKFEITFERTETIMNTNKSQRRFFYVRLKRHKTFEKKARFNLLV